MERVMGGVERRVLGVYGRSLGWFLRRRSVAAAIWVVCLVGTVGLFMIVPKAFLPVGDSSVIFGVFIAPRGLVAGADAASSRTGPTRCSARTTNAVTAFTMTGNGAVPVVEPGHHVHLPQAARASARRSRTSPAS